MAPSPTGTLHIGTARTALFNWLYAKKENGTFLLRIEDTDIERSKEHYSKNIFDGLKWLGIYWDEPPTIQSERANEHKQVIKTLIENGHAYRCYASEEELDEMRETQKKNGLAPKYDNRHRNLTSEQESEFIKAGREPVIRFKINEQKLISWNDLIRGKMTWSGKDLGGDMVIARRAPANTIGDPLYNLVVVADEKKAREVAELRRDRLREGRIAEQKAAKLDQMFSRMAEGDVSYVNLIIKADVQGSVEALNESLMKIQTDEAKVKIIAALHQQIAHFPQSSKRRRAGGRHMQNKAGNKVFRLPFPKRVFGVFIDDNNHIRNQGGIIQLILGAYPDEFHGVVAAAVISKRGKFNHFGKLTAVTSRHGVVFTFNIVHHDRTGVVQQVGYHLPHTFTAAGWGKGNQVPGLGKPQQFGVKASQYIPGLA